MPVENLCSKGHLTQGLHPAPKYEHAKRKGGGLSAKGKRGEMGLSLGLDSQRQPKTEFSRRLTAATCRHTHTETGAFANTHSPEVASF